MPNVLASHATEHSYTVEAPVLLEVRESKTSPNTLVVTVDHPQEGRKRVATVGIRRNGDIAVRTLADQRLSRFALADLDDDTDDE